MPGSARRAGRRPPRARRSLISRRWFVTSALLLALLGLPQGARADDIDNFLFALTPYLNAEYAVAVNRFEPLVGSDPPRLRPELLEAARRYYAASLVFTGQDDRAARVMLDLLRANPDAEFNARDFSAPIIRLFQATRAAHQSEIQRAATERAAAVAQAEQRRARQRALVIDLLTHERVPVVTPRWPMFVPFGVGQFVNGDVGMGVLFGALPVVGVVTGIAGGLNALSCPLSTPPYAPGDPNGPCVLASNVVLITGYVTAGLLLAGGVLHANLTYRPGRTVLRTRPLPPELRTLRLGVAPPPSGQGALFRVGLRF